MFVFDMYIIRPVFTGLFVLVFWNQLYNVVAQQHVSFVMKHVAQCFKAIDVGLEVPQCKQLRINLFMKFMYVPEPVETPHCGEGAIVSHFS